MKATMSVDPRLLKMLGEKLYSSHPLPIVVRELLQNARDACLRLGIEPDIRIALDVLGMRVTVTCRDNGIGMTEEELVGNFLCLGRTSKDGDTTSTGKFGIAKAAIMRNDNWSVHTLDNYIDNTFFTAEEMDIEKIEYLPGTEVKVEIVRDSYRSDIENALNTIYGSDVHVTLTMNNEKCTIDEDAGFRSELDEMYGSPDWVFGIAEEIRTPFHCIHGRTFFRLNGLVQFSVGSYNERRSNFFVDVTPTADATSPNYPFSMSRESLISKLRNDVDAIINKYDANPISTDDNVVANHKKDRTIKLSGSKPFTGTRRSRRERILMTTPQGVVALAPSQANHRKIVVSTEGELMMFDSYKKAERNVEKDLRLLAVWRELLRLTCTEDDEFGIGFTMDPTVTGIRQHHEGNTYYLVNPDTAINADFIEAKLWLLYDHAVHESAHFTVETHSEQFTVEFSLIKQETIVPFLENFQIYKKMLKGEI